MENNTTNDKIIGLRNCYFLLFSIFSLIHLTVVSIDNDIYFKIPVILYFFISFSLFSLFHTSLSSLFLPLTLFGLS